MEAWLSTTTGISASRVTAVAISNAESTNIGLLEDCDQGLIACAGIEFQIRNLGNTSVFAYHTGIPIQINALQLLRVAIFIILLLCSCKHAT
jgi:hypothetical protein